MIELDVDMSYLLECDELDKVVLNDESGEHEPMEFVPKDAATVSNRSCASCPEMDNPDSYIVHLHRALEVADSGAGTCQNIAELNREGVAGYFFVCSECGLAVHASFDICETNYPYCKPDGSTDLRTFNSNGEYEFERCPRCGRKVTE